MPVTHVRNDQSRTDLRQRTTDLGEGSRGAAVQRLQESLVRAGVMSQAEMNTGAGKFGPRTTDAVKELQRAAGLPETGRVDGPTRTALAERAAPAANPTASPNPSARATTPSTTSPATGAPAARRPAADAQTVTDSRRRAMTSPGLPLPGRSGPGAAVSRGHVPAPSLDQVRSGGKKLNHGMQGPAVTELQERLNRDGARLETDGKFGGRTQAALRDWQQSRGITDTGVLGPTTLRAMDQNAPARAATSTGDDSTPARTEGPVRVGSTAGMTEAQRYDHYSALAAQNGGQVKTGPGQRNIVGLRTTTDADANGGQGRYDDRMAMFWQDANGTKHAREYVGNTEPSARYRGRMGQDANGDGRLDQGRLAAGFYEFRTGSSSTLGRVLRPVQDYRVERDTNQNGTFGDDGGRRTGGGSSMLFHAGGSSITGSAGCQTMTPTEFNRFWRDLGGNPGNIGYTLIQT